MSVLSESTSVTDARYSVYDSRLTRIIERKNVA